MPSWVDHYKAHGVWTALEELRALVNDTPAEEDPDDEDTRQFVLAIASVLEHHRRSGDALGYSPSALSKAEAAVRALNTAYREWREGTSTNAVVDSNVETVIEAMSVWPALSADGVAKNAEEIVTQMADALGKTLKRVADERDVLIQQLTDTKGELLVAQEELASLQRSTNAELESMKSNWDETLKRQRTSGRTHLSELEKTREEARRVLHETTGDLVGTEYATYAAARRRVATGYDIAATTFGLGGLIVLAVFLHDAVKETNLDSLLIVARLGVTLGAIVIGGFLAARGAAEHKEARSAQRTALALTRMAPFITNLPRDAQEVLTIETADRIFTKGELEGASDRSPVLRRLSETREQKAAREAETRAARDART